MMHMTRQRILLHESGKRFLIRDTDKDFHCQFGSISSADLNSSEGTEIRTNKDIALRVMDARLPDLFAKMKRNAQIIPSKDVGFIISETGLNKESIVVDAGAGSGGLCLSLAAIAKKVYSYDIRDDHIEIVKQNKEMLGLKNLEIGKKDITSDSIRVKADILTLDIPAPWDALDNTAKTLKPGGFLVSYSPTIPQTSDMVERAREHGSFTHIKTVEVSEREWEFTGRKIRPKTQQRIGHSGFLSFFRKTLA